MTDASRVHYQFDGRRFTTPCHLANHIARRHDLSPKSVTWQVYDGDRSYIIRYRGKVIFKRGYVEAGDVRIINEATL